MKKFRCDRSALFILFISLSIISCKDNIRPGNQVEQYIRSELALNISFPDEKHENEGCFLANPRFIDKDKSGNLFVSDQSQNKVFIFRKNGQFVNQLGRGGQGPGDFDVPSDLAIGPEYILLKEISRFQYLDKEGRSLRSFADSKGYYRIALRSDGYIFALPLLKDTTAKLVDILSPEGHIVYSFGERMEFERDIGVLNFCNIKVFENNIYTAFKHFPIVRKYSDDGELIDTYKISYDSMDDIEKDNMESYRAHLIGKRQGFKSAISNIDITKEGLYLLCGDELKIQILKYDFDGDMKAIYWFNRPKNYYVDEFVVMKEAGRDVFYLLQISPEAKIDVYWPNS